MDYEPQLPHKTHPLCIPRKVNDCLVQVPFAPLDPNLRDNGYEMII